MKLFITRHGETDYNQKGLLSGSSNAMLTVKGRAQAMGLAEKIMQNRKEYNIKTIFVSPLQRAVDTASYIEEKLGIHGITDKRLSEVHFGDMENTPWPSEAFLFRRSNPFVCFPNGESLAKSCHRAYSLIEEVRQNYKDGNVLFVCHGLITVLMTTFFKDVSQEELAAIRVPNCCLLEFDLG